MCAGVIGLCLLCFWAGVSYRSVRNARLRQASLAERRSSWYALRDALKAEIAAFNGEAAVVIKDLETGWEISYNKDAPLPAASLVKVPIMGACFLAAEEAKVKLQQQVALRQADKLTGSGILKHARPGTAFSVAQLIGLMIYESDNTATNMLTSLLGIEYLNAALARFGLEHTALRRRVADFRARDRGIENYTTAADMARILERIYRRELVSPSASEKCLQILKMQRVNDRIPRYLPAEASVAHKTGLERRVCHDAGIVFTRNGDYLISVLTRHHNGKSSLSKEFIARVAFRVYAYFDGLSG